jgi:alanyl-tRNA synthetase
MKTKDLRAKFLSYFEKQNHRIIPSSPVIPHDDPTLLFVNAGMNQFKKAFLGQTNIGYKRASTSQKCIRVGGKHNDLDNVGHTSRHCTFFEMLGNFSFGDYFKEKAIEYAWDLSTNGLGIPPEKIYVTVYYKDDEAYELWQKWVPTERIVKIETNDNFWSMGDVGPCGPCTELFYDKAPHLTHIKSPKEDPTSARFLEFWNVVFMQYNRNEDTQLIPLPNPCVDTGMGMERMVSLMMGVESVFETDILRSIIQRVEEVSKIKYEKNKPAFNVIADHLRCLSFAIADGAQPSNLDRGYVLRKVLRRASRYGKQLGLEDPFLAKIFPTLLYEMGEDYPELESAKTKILEILSIEEENFLRTLKRGGNILNTIIQESKGQISGKDAFKLKDTYGFPIEEIVLLAKDHALEVNLDAFLILEEEAKELSRKSHTKHAQMAETTLFSDFAKSHEPNIFVGYDDLETNASIIGIIKNGKLSESLQNGEEGAIILDRTTFYASLGGQVGDEGQIIHHSANFAVTSTTSPYPGVIVHTGILRSGTFLTGEPVHTRVNEERRKQICRNHTATHLLHWGLEQVLGTHIRQAGSLVEPNYLRFDFSHHKPMTSAEIRLVELLINDKIRTDGPVITLEMSYEVAKDRKDVKQFFGEKYTSVVRMVDIDDFSRELCGGTHVSSLRQIGLFRIVKESSIAAGVRRIEAVTGKEAENYMYEREDILEKSANLVESLPSNFLQKVTGLIEENAHLKTQVKNLRKAHLKTLLDDLLSKKDSVKGIHLIAEKVELFKDEFAPLANDLLLRLGSGIILLGVEDGARCQLLLKVSQDLIEKGFKANELIQEIAKIVGGTGGGKPDMAQAGGKDPSKMKDAFSIFKRLVDQK